MTRQTNQRLEDASQHTSTEDSSAMLRLQEGVLATHELLKQSSRPVMLIGGGVSRHLASEIEPELERTGLALMTTWNGADRLNWETKNFFGRPNTWGMRFSNVLVQQSDLVIAIGTRLGLQQTGFNFAGFAPLAKIVHVDIDSFELQKPIPRERIRVHADADRFLTLFLAEIRKAKGPLEKQWRSWIEFCSEVSHQLPISELANAASAPFVNPYDFYAQLALVMSRGDILVPSSSGASETVAMQAFPNPPGVRIGTSKGLASMGYGLASAIGAAFADPDATVFHVEGDGGFAQNAQEMGTVAANNLRIKSFILSNNGYASIRMTQANYFRGHYVGCDSSTGLGLPDWELYSKSYGITYLSLTSTSLYDKKFWSLLNGDGPAIIEVRVDPSQTYFPKLTSAIGKDGKMTTDPLHLMTPPLPESESQLVLKFLEP